MQKWESRKLYIEWTNRTRLMKTPLKACLPTKMSRMIS